MSVLNSRVRRLEAKQLTVLARAVWGHVDNTRLVGRALALAHSVDP